MTLYIEFLYKDEAYNAIINIDNLSKKNSVMKKMCNDFETEVEMDIVEGNEMKMKCIEVTQEMIVGIWKYLNAKEIRIKQPCYIDGCFLLLTKIDRE